MRGAVGFAILLASAVAVPGVAMADPLEGGLEFSQSAPAKIAPVSVKLASDFRLRADLLTTSARVDPLANPDGQVRHRFASSMIDFYPLGGNSGLRISGGMRFFSVNNFFKDAEKSTGGLLWAPRIPGSGSGVRTGFARHTPAATIGYTSTYKNAVFGFEVGSLIGNANASLPRTYNVAASPRGGLNPIANLVVGLRF